MSTKNRVTAVLLTVVLVLSLFASTPVSGEVRSGGETTVGNTAAPVISIPNATIDDSTESQIEVAYNVTGEVDVSDLKIQVSGPDYFASAKSDSHYNFVANVTKEKDTLNVTVPAGEFGGGNFSLNAFLINESTGNLVTTDDATLSVTSPADLTDYSVSSKTVAVGENVTVTATISNNGSTNTTYTVAAYKSGKASGYTEYVAQPKVPAGETKTVKFNVSYSRTGTYNLTVNQQTSTTITVESPIQVTNHSVSRTDVYTFQNVTVNATVKNTADSTKTAKIPLNLHYNGYTNNGAKEKSVTLAAGETTNISFTKTVVRSGLGGISVGTTSPTTLNVTRSPVFVDEISISDRSLNQSESTSVNATLYNSGDQTLSQVVVLTKNRQAVAKKNITITADASKTVSFTTAFDVGGTHALDVNHRDSPKITVASPDVSVVDYTVSDTTVYEQDRFTVTATVKNTGSAERAFAVAPWSGTELNSFQKTVRVGAGSTKTVSFEYVSFGETGEQNITINNEPNTTITVKDGIRVTDRNISASVVALGEPITFNVTLKNPTSSARSEHVSVWAGQSLGREVTVDAGTTKTVSFSTTYTEPGEKYVYIAGVNKQVFVVNQSTGSANLSVTETFAPSTAVNGSEAWFSARVTNGGDAAGVKNVSLTIGGRVVASDRVYVPANETRSAFLEHTFNQTGGYSGTFAGEPLNLTVREEVVVSTSVEAIAGTQPTSSPNVSAHYSSGYISLQVTSGDESISAYNLSRLGADNTTVFEITLTTKNYNPRLLVSNGQSLNWTTSAGPTANTTNITIRAQPGQLDFKTQFKNERPERPSQWDDVVVNDTADFGWEAALLMGIGNARVSGIDANAEAIDGLTVSTDAQMFSMPTYQPATNDTEPALRIPLAAPHETVNGNVNQGYYKTFLPNSLLDAWNVTDPESQLVGHYSADGDTNLTVQNVSGGVLVSMDLHYSSGTVTITTQSSTTISDTTSSSPNTTTGDQSTSEDTSDSSSTSPSTDPVTTNPTSSTDPTNTVSNTQPTGEPPSTVTTNETEHQPKVVVKTNATAITATVENVSANESVTIDLAQNATATSTPAVNSLEIAVDNTSQFSLTVDSSTENPNTALPSLESVESTEPVLYLNVSHPSLTDDQIESATFTVTVPKERIRALNATPANVSLYRYHDGWNAVNTSLKTETKSAYVFEATSPGLSVFAVGVQNDTSRAVTKTTTTTSQTTTTKVETTTAESETATTTGKSPGFGIGVSLISLLAAALLVMRRE